VVIGGAYSNNVLGIVQLLIENGIEPVLFLLGDAQKELQGTHLLIRMLMKASSIHWISREDWPGVVELAEEYALKQRNQRIHTVVIPEGSVMTEAIPGAVTLALDIIRNENSLGVNFERIFMDAGTGFQAAVALLTYSWLEKPTQFYVVLMADAVEVFEDKLRRFHVAYEKWLNQKISFPTNYTLLHPLTARSFGSVNAGVYDTMIDLARKEGIFVDPIYSAKLFNRSRQYLSDGIYKGNTLIVHSGGALSLTGFQSQLAKRIGECDE
jgi:1-aminocyclopropane-1-carboxylate deaminase/D-cysteine desulfhydrase-like pyridoxal-dependent ACC family enzyme